MLALFEYVSLLVDGTVLMGWQEVEVSRSMQHAAIGFSLTATNSAWSPAAMALRRGRDVQIFTGPDRGAVLRGGGDLLCAGAVDTYNAEIGEDGSKTVKITGRSKARDGIDCQPVKHKTGRVENKDLLGVAQEFDEFGIGFSTDQQLQKIPLVQRIPNETMLATIEREARCQGLMLAGQPSGQVAITRANTKRHAGQLVEGQSPVRRWSINVAPHMKRSPVVVRGQKRLGTGKDNLRQEYQDKGDGTDAHRPLLVIAEGDYTVQDLKKRAQWERLRAAGHGISVTARVSRWRDDDGALWDPGRLMAVDVPSEDIDQDLTLSTVKFRQVLGEQEGTTAELNFVDPKAHGGKAGQGSSDPAFDVGDGLDG